MLSKSLKKGNIEVRLELGKKASFNLMALYHPLRKKLIVLIERKGKATVSDLYTELHLVPAETSQHLAILRRAGIVNIQREGKKIYYTVNGERVSEIATSAHALAPHEKKLDKGQKYLMNRPRTETVEMQIQNQWKVMGQKNRLKEIVGAWPGSETFETLSKMLTK
jgi:DNA-binding transcriptional ArsR family regulator